MSDQPEWVVMRRQDRSVKDVKWVRDLLQEVPVGTLAAVIDGKPHLHTNLFVLAPAAPRIYLHLAHEGQTLRAIAQNPQVCFTVHRMGRFLPAAAAGEFSVEFASVVAHGVAALVADEGEAREALEWLMQRYFAHLRPGTDYRPITAGEQARTSVLRIDITAWSGKEKRAPADFPGAFLFPGPA